MIKACLATRWVDGNFSRYGAVHSVIFFFGPGSPFGSRAKRTFTSFSSLVTAISVTDQALPKLPDNIVG
jgi:hypothetical protein